MLKIAGGTLFGLLAFAAAVITAFLFYLGFTNNWTSDGPAMLLVFLGIPFFALAAAGLGWVTFAIIFSKNPASTTP